MLSAMRCGGNGSVQSGEFGVAAAAIKLRLRISKRKDERRLIRAMPDFTPLRTNAVGYNQDRNLHFYAPTHPMDCPPQWTLIHAATKLPRTKSKPTATASDKSVPPPRVLPLQANSKRLRANGYFLRRN